MICVQHQEALTALNREVVYRWRAVGGRAVSFHFPIYLHSFTVVDSDFFAIFSNRMHR